MEFAIGVCCSAVWLRDFVFAYMQKAGFLMAHIVETKN